MKVLTRIPSNTHRGVKYRIIQGADRKIYCECAGWMWRKTCSHLKKFKKSRRSS